MLEVTVPTAEDYAIYMTLATPTETRSLESAVVFSDVMNESHFAATRVSANIPYMANGEFSVARMVRNRIFHNVGGMSAKSIY